MTDIPYPERKQGQSAAKITTTQCEKTGEHVCLIPLVQ
jgi:hypothetical protein